MTGRRFGFSRRKAVFGRKGKDSPIRVFNESNKVVFRGKGRRKYQEVVFFDSNLGKRVFFLTRGKIKRKRITQLEKLWPSKSFLGKTVFVDQRNPKHKKMHERV